MSDETKKMAVPAYLIKRLEAFRIVKGDQHSYVVRDKLKSVTYDFEPWQFFVLEVLPGCDNYPKLFSIFEDRFGRPISKAQVEELFAMVAEKKLFIDDAQNHPLLAPFMVSGLPPPSKSESESRAAKPAASDPAKAVTGIVKEAAAQAVDADALLAPGVQDNSDFDPRRIRALYKIFDPRPLMNLLMPVARVLRYGVYLLPLLFAITVFIAVQYAPIVLDDLNRLRHEWAFFARVAFSLLVVNLLSTFVTAFTAHYYRCSVDAIGIGINLGFVPRFMARVAVLKDLPRRERLWLVSAPILLRLALLGLAMMLWFNTRNRLPDLASVAMGMSLICTFDILIWGNPLVKGAGYDILSVFLDEPRLGLKAYTAFLNKWRGNVYKQSDSNILAIYALAMLVYTFLVVLATLVMLGLGLKEFELGGSVIIITVGLGLYLANSTWDRLSKVQQAYERSVQYDRWRKRALPAEAVDETLVKAQQPSLWRYGKLALGITLLILLFVPYPYEAGGNFTVYPSRRQNIAGDEAGLISQVFFDGGEVGLKKGTVVARLASPDFQAQVKVYTAKVAEQEAVVAELYARPKPEQIKLAQSELDVAKKEALYSSAKAPRLEKLFREGAVSYEEWQTSVKQAAVDLDQVEQKKAQLALVKVGATVEQIEAAEGQLQALREQLADFVAKVERMDLVMPIDGNILTLHLQNKVNTFLDKGAVFAQVENPDYMTVDVEVPEYDVRFVSMKSVARVRPSAFFDEDDFEGKVSLIDRNVVTRGFGSIVHVLLTVKNRDAKLRTGMTGYAKISIEWMPVWRAFSLSVIRFFQVQVWSWIP